MILDRFENKGRDVRLQCKIAGCCNRIVSNQCPDPFHIKYLLGPPIEVKIQRSVHRCADGITVANTQHGHLQ
ncbi:hypothetical protein ASE23_22585 [Rhizobium sp. Root73]|nr:hypothetical protein ASE23_22585 [Rhizobium sp. Root73]